MLDEDELRNISKITLQHYNDGAGGFWEGTRDHDVQQNRTALLDAIEGPTPYRILDLGCGPGRDLQFFRKLGHDAVGLDGSERFVAMAREHSGCVVLQQDFLKLSLAPEDFDGVFANASLFHVPRQELPRVLGELRDTLKPGGVLFSSNPRGENQEGWNRNRYGSFHDLESWRRYAIDADFMEIRHYYRPPGKPRAEQPWLATVWRKPRGTDR